MPSGVPRTTLVRCKEMVPDLTGGLEPCFSIRGALPGRGALNPALFHSYTIRKRILRKQREREVYKSILLAGWRTQPVRLRELERLQQVCAGAVSLILLASQEGRFWPPAAWEVKEEHPQKKSTDTHKDTHERRCHPSKTDDGGQHRRTDDIKKLLAVFLLILTVTTTLSNAQCFIKPSSKNGCLRLGKIHQVHSVWKTKDCHRCECKPGEMICCSLVFRPINYDKKNCVAMFHKPTCSIQVVKKTDPAEACKVFAGVG